MNANKEIMNAKEPVKNVSTYKARTNASVKKDI